MTFCGKCGAQLTDGVKYCSACGSTVSIGPVTVVAPPQAVPVKPGTSFLVRLLLTVYGIGLLIALAGIGFLLHAVNNAPPLEARAGQALSGAAPLAALTSPAPGNAEAGAILRDLQNALPLDGQAAKALLNAAPAAAPAGNAPTVVQSNPAALTKRHVSESDGQCAIFTLEELTQVLGTKMTHATPDATGCAYKGDGPRMWVRSEALWTGGKNLVKERSDTYANLRQSMINQHYTKAEIDAHAFPITPYPGVGDEAFMNLWNVVIARKGDAGINLDLRYYRDNDDLTKLMANTALSRIAGQ
jgi:hypothetical protein